MFNFSSNNEQRARDIPYVYLPGGWLLMSELGDSSDAIPRWKPGMIPDLRKFSCDRVVARVERALGVRLDVISAVRKRRSLGLRSDRGTWVRIEARSVEHLDGQGWNGVECAQAIDGVNKPAWYQGFSWRDDVEPLLWRADEIELITATPINNVANAQHLPASWWSTLASSLNALAGHSSARVATRYGLLINQDRITWTINKAFPDQVDTKIEEWTVSHADLIWSNVTGPQCYLLDWESWGLAPRGWDPATLWSESFTAQNIAKQIQQNYVTDLNSRSGRLSQLFFCANVLRVADAYPRPIVEAAQREAVRLVEQLHSRTAGY